MVNVSATRMDTVATVSLDTQAPNVNMTLMNVKQTMTIPVSITVKIFHVHTSVAVIPGTSWIHSDVLTLMSVPVSSVILADVSMKRDLSGVNVTQDTIMIQ